MAGSLHPTKGLEQDVSRIRVRLEDESWFFDEDEVTIEDAIALKYATGLALKPFFEGLSDMDGVALRALVWFLRGKQGSPEAVNFKVTALKLEQEPDPTEGDATPSESAATA
jgi:hypothetical protein